MDLYSGNSPLCISHACRGSLVCDLYTFIGMFCLSFLLMNESILINGASLQDKDKDTPAASSQGASLGPSERFSIMISR